MQKLVLILAFLASTARAQVTEPTPVPMPPLTIDGTHVDATVTYDATRGVYRYAYSIVAPATNKVNVHGVRIDISGKTDHVPQIDPSLQNNVTRTETAYRQLQPNTTLPVGFVVPDPSNTMAAVTMKSEAMVACEAVGGGVQPGANAGFVLESKFAPAVRNVVITPDKRLWQEFVKNFPPNTLFDNDTSYDVSATTIAPFEATDADLFDGGGQQPAEVNKFLRYEQPTDSRTKLPASVTSYYVIVYYGKTIQPATFSAALNGADITGQFHPYPGAADAVKVPIGPGTTKVHLEVVGLKSSGATARDSDTLTFLPQ